MASGACSLENSPLNLVGLREKCEAQLCEALDSIDGAKILVLDEELIGPLGTVVGIIETFRMIMLLGTGDVQTLSDGIYQALITTQVGLVVAIPALLLHAFLSRQARGVTDRMVQAALSFVNTVAVANPKTSRSGSTLPDPLGATDSERNETREALVELLGPLLDRTNPTPSPGTKG